MPNRSYQKGYRHENNEVKFWERHFGRFWDHVYGGTGLRSRSFMSRGADVRFVDWVFRVWKVSCKVKKVPKWIWDELESNDILSVKHDYKGTLKIMTEEKLDELLGQAEIKRASMQLGTPHIAEPIE
jgi:hypothetical protein